MPAGLAPVFAADGLAPTGILAPAAFPGGVVFSGAGAGGVTGRGFDFISRISFVRSDPTRLKKAQPQKTDEMTRKYVISAHPMPNLALR